MTYRGYYHNYPFLFREMLCDAACVELFARLALIEDQSCRESKAEAVLHERLLLALGGRYDHHHRGNFLIGLPKGGCWLAGFFARVTQLDQNGSKCAYPQESMKFTRIFDL